MRLLALAVLAACGSSGGGPTTVVVAMAGDRAEGGAPIATHRVDGTLIDEGFADATGRAEIGTEAGALVSVIFAHTDATSIVTAPALPVGDLVIVGPPRPPVPQIVGGLVLTAPPLAADFGYDVALGCATIQVTAFPTTVDVAATCLGHDSNLDVLVRGYHFTGEDLPPDVVGYAAGRVPMVDGVAHFDIATWETDGTIVPITLDGVAPALDLVLWADGLAFPTREITDHAEVWHGFLADASTVHASLGFTGLAELTSVEAPGAPASITFGAADFLPELDAAVLLDDRATLAVRWAAAGTADALDLRLAWTSGTRFVWDAVLPPDADRVAFPQLAVPMPTDPAITIDATFRAIDSSELADFAALEAAGIHVTDPVQPSSIAPRPAMGELRTSLESGFR